MDLLLGIDVGTTNCKAVAYNERGEPVASGKTAMITHYKNDGTSYYDPVQIWEAVVGVIRQTVTKLNVTDKIIAISVASMGEAGVPVDRNGTPIYPVITWFDSRSLPQSHELAEKIGNERIFEITGLDNNPIFSVSKLMWIREHEPEVYARIDKWLCISDYIYLKLSGVIATDYSIASRTMALDISTRDWSDEILDKSGLARSLFPDLVASGTVLGKVAREAAEKTGLSQDALVIAGGHDHYCGSFASGILLGHRVADSSGTAESIHGLLEPGVEPPKNFQGFRIGRYLDPNRLYLVGGIVASGASVEWAMKQFNTGVNSGKTSKIDRQSIYDEVMEQVESVSPGSGGLLFLPHLRGGGAPYWDPYSRGAFLGLLSKHTAADLMRAVIEGLCFEVRTIVDAMRGISGNPVKLLTVVGGGARNKFWQQTKADITGIPVEVPDVDEATTLGAALLAGIGAGVYRNMVEASRLTYRVKTVFEPSSKNKDLYHHLFQIYRKVYQKLKNLNSELYSFSQFYMNSSIKERTNEGDIH